MKQSDIISIIGVAIVGFVLSYFIVGTFFKPDEAKKTYTTINTISSNVDLPAEDSDMFNVNVINPTVEVYIGNCVDVNQDGILSDEEKDACNAIDAK